jgi:hypothetical protein
MSKNTCGDYVDPAKQYQKMCGGVRSRKQQKKVGGTMQYPFQTEFHHYPVPNKVDFKVDNATDMVKDVDIFGCKGAIDANVFVNPKLVGGDCGCASSTMKLGGTLQQQNKHTGAGYGYTFNMKDAIGNRPEVDRYPTDSALAGGSMKKNKYLVEISKQHQKGGSAASDSLMNYFLDFQHRCRGSEIY